MRNSPALPLVLALCLVILAALRGPAGAAVDAARDELNAGTDSDVDLHPPEEVEAFSFVVFGDRTGGPDSGLGVLGDAVEMANHLGPDFAMTVGDLVDGYNEERAWLRQMRAYKEVMSELEAPWFPVAGNHDVYARPQRPEGHIPLYERHFGPLYYSFDYRWAHFVCLFTDEQLAFHDPARNQNFGEEQLAWLERDLAACEAERIFVFQHHPRWNYAGTNWERVHEMLAASGRPVTVFAGHKHQYRDDGVRDGVRYLTLGRTGASGGTYDTSASLHHINHVHVRRERVAMAMLPVGSIHGGDAVTGDELDAMHALRRGDWLRAEAQGVMHSDRAGEVSFRLTLENPIDRALPWSLRDVGRDEIELEATRRGRLRPGESRVIELAGSLPRFAVRRPDVRLAVRLEYDLASGLSQSIEREVPARIRLPEFAQASREHAPGTSPIDRALRLDGASALRVDLPEAFDALTLETWVRGAATEERTGLIAKTQNSAFGLFWKEPDADLPGAFLHSRNLPPAGQPGYASAWAREPWDFESWTHLALAWDGEDLRFFVDGRLAEEVAAPAPATWNQLPLWIGADPDGRGRAMSFFRGELDEVRLSSTARYTADFEPPSEPFEADEATELLLHFDHAHGELHPDASGRERHAWAQGSPELVPREP